MSFLTILICIFSIPLLISLSFLTISAPTLIVLTNFNFSNVKSTCQDYKNLTADYGLNRCLVPVIAELDNLFSILLVVSTFITMLLCLKSNLRYKKKLKHALSRMTEEIEELQTTNTGLEVVFQRNNGNFVSPEPTPQTPYVARTRPMMVSPALSATEDERAPLVDNLPNYDSVMGPDPKSNQNNLRSMKRFPTMTKN